MRLRSHLSRKKLGRVVSSNERVVRILVILLVAVAGFITLRAIYAASYAVAAETESGSLGGVASIVSDATASGGRAVMFNSSYTSSSGSSSGSGKSGGSSGGSGSTGGTSSAGGCTVSGTVAPCMNGGASGGGASGYGQPVFDDEFNGSSVNTSNWIPGRRLGSGTCTSSCAGYNPSSESEVFDSSKVTESGGSLALTATKSSGSSWTSGAAEMQHGKNFVYGYFEARIKVPDPSDAWTAYWLTSASGWPPELDIFEFNFCNSEPTFNNHGTSSGSNVNASGWPCSEAYGGSGTDFTQWHTYGLLWTSSSIKVFFDGKQQSLSTTGNGIPSTPMYPIFDYAIASGSNPPNNSQMDIDYMRIWCPGGGTSCMTSNT